MGFYMFLPQKDCERSGFYRRFDGWGEVDLQHWLVGGFSPTPKNDGLKVSWDDEIPNMMGKS